MSTREPPVHKLRAAIDIHLPRKWKLLEHLPNGFYYIYADKCWTQGLTNWDTRTIHCPIIFDRCTLFIFLHECGHIHGGHEAVHADNSAQEEYEAEIYAREAMRGMGFAVPKLMLKQGRDYVRSWVEQDDVVTFSDDVLKFAYGSKWREYK